MKKKIAKQLKRIAQATPPILKHSSVVKSGAEILASNPDAKLKDGTEIDAKKYYKHTVAIGVSREAELKRLYRTGGVKAVNEYIAKLNAQASKQ